jgi:hypothetical protein
MSRLTVRLPDTLHHQLANNAKSEGVSLNQYIVYLLTRQITLAYTVQPVPDPDISQQKKAFTALLQSLGKASFEQIKAVMDEREPISAERELKPEIVTQMRKRLSNR